MRSIDAMGMRSTGSRVLLACALFCQTVSCAGAQGREKDMPRIGEGALMVAVEPGPGWLHRFSALKTNAPQLAIWIEDEGGAYVKTLYATRKIATEGWIFNRGNRRKEALPYWCHRRGVRYADGLFLPTKKAPLTDALTSASPRAGFQVAFDPPGSLRRFWIYLEVNHSTDFNAAYPRDAVEGGPGWSGGKEGSGQPALVYRILVDLDVRPIASAFELAGRASADGSDGALYADVSGMDTALGILGSMEVLSD